jgi:dethiobiotin synthetase
MPVERKGLFITGTDTGVGKTFVTAGLARCLKDRGIATGVLKPAETGCALRKGRRIPSDGAFLRHMAGAREPIEEMVPYRLAAPLAPQVAAEREGIRIQPRRLQSAFRKISSRYDCTLVEGAGGILVPVTRKTTMVDLMKQFRLPVLLVIRIGLGTLNHTLLTLFYLAQHDIAVAGIVMNDPDGCRDLSARSNPATLKQWTSVPIFGNIPFRKGIRMTRQFGDEIARRFARYVDVDRICQVCKVDTLQVKQPRRRKRLEELKDLKGKVHVELDLQRSRIRRG